MLYYYAHRYSNSDQAIQQANLARAKQRLAYLGPSFRARGIVLWAPWIEMAEAGVPEDAAWLVIEKCVRVCDGIVLDLDGADEPSPGMGREWKIAETVGAKVEVVR